MTEYRRWPVERMREECARRGISWRRLGREWFFYIMDVFYCIDARAEAAALSTALEYHDRAVEENKKWEAIG